MKIKTSLSYIAGIIFFDTGDIAGTSRPGPSGGNSDLGAYEYVE
jgi:hypothetical protein